MVFLEVHLDSTTRYLLAALASLVAVILCKVFFHCLPRVSGAVPESGLVIVLGLAAGGILYGVGAADILAGSQTVQVIVFSFLLPNIVFPDSFHLDTRTFFSQVSICN